MYKLHPILPIFLHSILLTFFCASLACKEKAKHIAEIAITKEDPPPRFGKNYKIPADSVWLKDHDFIADSILHGYKKQLAYYYKKYNSDSCSDLTRKETLRERTAKKKIGRVRLKGPATDVIVLYPFNPCKPEDGDAYYFSDTSLPRIMTDSYCCTPNNIFLVGDIDEDGVSEVGLYNSSCVSRYKELIVYSLKNDQWKEVGNCVFDIVYSENVKNYGKYVQKTGKGKFEMLEITDLTEKENIGKKVWLKFSF